MLDFETETLAQGITSREVFKFLANPSDRDYQRWWPGVHLQMHTLSRADGHVGDVVLMDELVGTRRLRLKGIILEAVPGKSVVWQLAAGIRLPVYLSLELADAANGVVITHRVRAGWRGWGCLLDPLIRLYFSRAFVTALEDHVRTEFRLLRDGLKEVHAMPA